MLNAYKQFWTRYVDFKGRSTRSDFWWVMLWHTIIVLPLFLIAIFAFVASVGSIFEDALDGGLDISDFSGVMAFAPLLILVIIYYLAILIPHLALTVRRLRDANFHWAFIFIWTGPALLAALTGMDIFKTLHGLGFIAVLVLCSMPSKDPQVIDQNKQFNGQGYPQHPGQAGPFNGQGHPQQPGQAGQFNAQGYPQQPGQAGQFNGQGYPQEAGQAGPFNGQGYPQQDAPVFENQTEPTNEPNQSATLVDQTPGQAPVEFVAPSPASEAVSANEELEEPTASPNFQAQQDLTDEADKSQDKQ